MRKIITENSTILVLDRGEELIESLNNFANENQLSGAWLSGLGAAQKMTIGYYDLDTREYVWTDINDGIVEILNLAGNLSFLNNKPSWHVHGVFSGTDLKAFGGHIKEMYVGLTCELNITPLDSKESLQRVYDDATGLNLLG